MSIDLAFPMNVSAPITTQGADLSVTGKLYPGVVLVPLSTEASQQYSVVREVNGAQWVVQNADIGGNGWQIIYPASPAWALVQLPGGGIAQYTAPGNSPPGFTWTRLFYVDNTGTLQSPVATGAGVIAATTDISPLTIMNWLHFNPSPGAGGSSSINDTAMNNLIAGLNAVLGGGRAWFPMNTYLIDPPVGGNGFIIPDQSALEAAGTSINGGTGSNKCLFASTGNGNLFAASGAHNGGGVSFRHFGISYPTSATSGIAIIAQIQNVRGEYCWFQNCPTAFWANGNSSGLRESTIFYNGPNGGSTPYTVIPMFLMQGNECFAIGQGEYFQPGQSVGGPSGVAAIAIKPACEHHFIQALHLSHPDYSVTYALSTGTGVINYGQIIGCEMAPWKTGIWMQPNSANTNIFGEKYIGCTIVLDSASTSVTPLVYIDNNGAQINDIEFNNLSVFGSSLHGYQINTGGAIRLIGGMSSGNGPSGGAGVCISGQIGDVLVKGMTLTPKYVGNAAQQQQYALLLTPTAVVNGLLLVEGCDMSGYAGPPVVVQSGATVAPNFIIRNCPGYTDQNTVINTTPPTSVNQNAANQGSAGGTSYYGEQELQFISPVGGTNFSYKGTTFAVPAAQYVFLRINNPYATIRFQ